MRVLEHKISPIAAPASVVTRQLTQEADRSVPDGAMSSTDTITSGVQRVPNSPPSAIISASQAASGASHSHFHSYSYSPASAPPPAAISAALSVFVDEEDSDGSPAPLLQSAPSQPPPPAPQLSPQDMVRVRLRKTTAGFGFTLADGKDGRQRVRQLLDVANPQVAQLRVRDQLMAIEDILVHHLRHDQVRVRFT